MHAKAIAQPILITVKDAAQSLSCKSAELLRAIKANGWNETHGVYHFLPGDQGYRIDLFAFLNWNKTPLSAAADQRYLEVAKAFLAILMPGRTVLNQCIGEFQDLYDGAARRIEETHHNSASREEGQPVLSNGSSERSS